MIHTNKIFQAAILALVAVSFCAFGGCKPAVTESVSAVEVQSQPNETTEVAFESESVAPIEGAVEVIGGDLHSVDWLSMIGKNVTIKGELVVVDTYDLARRGQIKVARDRLYIPTETIDPNDADANENSFEGGSNVAKVVGAQKVNDKGTIIIDDGSAKENIFPPTLFPKLGKSLPTVRIGSTINGVSGKLVKAGRNILLVPKGRLRWTPAERPARPDVGEANVTVASFNVLNYFTTIDNGRNNARGADSKSELDRQEAKLVAAIVELDADAIGLMELENNLESENRLVAALNERVGKDVFKGCGLPAGFASAPGGRDSIRVGIIYRSDRVETVGDVSMIRNQAFGLARVPVVQGFKSVTDPKTSFTLIVNHFKSKGGSDRADPENKNKGDGQGAFNATRRSQSLAICEYIEQQSKSVGKPRVLVIGDLNAYGQEDPIDAFRAKGLVDLHEQFAKDGQERYSYLYYGQSGSLDHALATDSLAKDVTGIATWHINADEPRILDYNEEHNPAPLYKADPYRSSDHDPVLIGIGN